MNVKNKIWLAILSFVIIICGLVLAKIFFQSNQLNNLIQEDNKKSLKYEVILENLKIPWEVRFLPNENILITERPGNLVVVENNQIIKRIPIKGVYATGEGGLLGLALHPNFEENHYVYLYYTYQQKKQIKNKVERFVFKNNDLLERQTIIENIPGSQNHNGGRIAFGPDGFLYITTGDAENKNSAQDTRSLAGKILRLNENGQIPPDNPFDNPVYSYGHRNIQGLAWDNKNNLWANEHGRSGVLSGLDELNLIEKGKNYGWPEIEGNQTKEGMEFPVFHSGADITWAPAGMIFYKNSLFFGGLRGQSLYEAKINNKKINELKTYFSGELGRIRVVSTDLENNLYIATSNTDGRGNPRKNDDKLIKIKWE